MLNKVIMKSIEECEKEVELLKSLRKDVQLIMIPAVIRMSDDGMIAMIENGNVMQRFNQEKSKEIQKALLEKYMSIE